MRSSSLITLLPLLAVTAINAHPHHHHRHHDHDDDDSTPARSHQRQSRKSIAFGPSHVNAEYRVGDLAVADADSMIMGIPEVNDVSEVEMKKEWANKVVEVLHEYKGFKGKEGVDWVIREDVSCRVPSQFPGYSVRLRLTSVPLISFLSAATFPIFRPSLAS